MVHVERLAEAVRLFVRLPAPLVLAHAPGDGNEVARRFVRTVERDGVAEHFINFDAVAQASGELTRLIAEGHVLRDQTLAQLAPTDASLRIHKATRQPRFARLEEARAVFSESSLAAATGQRETQVYVGDAVIDVALYYPTAHAYGRLELASSLSRGLAGEAHLANLILDHGLRTGQNSDSGPAIYRVTGLMNDPLALGASTLEAAWTFTKLGVEHISEGADHLIFLLCLVLGARRLLTLLGRITGFTAGHTLTLVAGFFGYVPASALFVPSVEMAVAMSIVYAAWLALRGQETHNTVWVIVGLGVLHGFAFSFVLSELLSVDAPAVLTSLLAFNVGVELGQALLVVIAWPVLFYLHRLYPSVADKVRRGLAIACIGVGCLWTGARFATVMSIALS